MTKLERAPTMLIKHLKRCSFVVQSTLVQKINDMVPIKLLSWGVQVTYLFEWQLRVFHVEKAHYIYIGHHDLALEPCILLTLLCIINVLDDVLQLKYTNLQQIDKLNVVLMFLFCLMLKYLLLFYIYKI